MVSDELVTRAQHKIRILNETTEQDKENRKFPLTQNRPSQNRQFQTETILRISEKIRKISENIAESKIKYNPINKLH